MLVFWANHHFMLYLFAEGGCVCIITHNVYLRVYGGGGLVVLA